MKRFKNDVQIKGYVFSLGEGFNQLQERIAKKSGTAYISGDLSIATNDDLTNVVTVHFTYVPEKTKKGTENSTYTNLKKIINDNRTVDNVGKENAAKVRVNGEFETNDFWSTRDEKFIAAPRIRGNFIHDFAGSVGDGDNATFSVETLISKVTEHEIGDETIVQLYAYVFNYFGDIMPVTFDVRSEGGKNYFLDADISNKNTLLTKVWGTILNREVTTYEDDEESAWGDAKQKKVTHVVRSWNVDGSSKEPMDFDDESTITSDELKKALSDRQQRLEEDKQRSEESHHNRSNGGSDYSNSVPVTTPPEMDEDDDDEFPF